LRQEALLDQVGLLFTEVLLASHLLANEREMVMYLDGCLLVLIAIAVYTDLRYRRISNLIIGGGLLIAFSGHYYTQGITGLAFGLKGLGVGLALLLVPFLLGGMGAGDVKLLGVIGAFKGSSFSVSVFLWMALWGGAMAIVLLLIKGQLVATIQRLGRGLLLAGMGAGSFGDVVSRKEFSIYYPYALAIALGVLTSYFKGW